MRRAACVRAETTSPPSPSRVPHPQPNAPLPHAHPYPPPLPPHPCMVRCTTYYPGRVTGGSSLVDRDGRFSFSLTAANRLARGSSGSAGFLVLEDDEEAAPPPRRRPLSPPPRLLDRDRLGSLSPVDCRMTRSVCHPGVARSWKASERSCHAATLQRRASSSCGEGDVSGRGGTGGTGGVPWTGRPSGG